MGNVEDRPKPASGRLAVLSGKLLALGVFLVVFVVLGLAAGAASSLVVARLEEAAVAWPSLGKRCGA